MQHLSVCLTLTIVLLMSSGARAEWQATLADAGEVRPPDSDIRIQLPAEVSVEDLPWLALEINDIDVSEIVRLEESALGFVVVVTPAQPLSPGSHRVRLVQYTPEGQILERGDWTVRTGKPTGYAENSLDIAATVSLGLPRGLRVPGGRMTNRRGVSYQAPRGNVVWRDGAHSAGTRVARAT